VCLNYEIYKSLDSVLEHFNGFATLYQNVNYSRDDFNGLDYRMVVSFDWNDSTVVATFQMDSKGKQNVSAGTNISQATGVAVAMPKGTMYTPQVLSIATADIIQTFPFWLTKYQHLCCMQSMVIHSNNISSCLYKCLPHKCIVINLQP